VAEDSTSITQNDCGAPSTGILIDFVEVAGGWYEASTCNNETDVGTALAVFSTSCSNLRAQEVDNQVFLSNLINHGEVISMDEHMLTSNECLTVSGENDAGCASVSFFAAGQACVLVVPEDAEGNYKVDVYRAPTPRSNYVVTGENSDQEEITVDCDETSTTEHGALHDFSLPAGDYLVSTCHEATEMNTDIVVLDGTCDQFRDMEVACMVSSICPAQEEVSGQGDVLQGENLVEFPVDDFASMEWEEFMNWLMEQLSGGLIVGQPSIPNITVTDEPSAVCEQRFECSGQGTTVSFSLPVGRNICVVTLFDDTGKYELSVESQIRRATLQDQ